MSDRKERKMPVENHKSAAWANIEKIDGDSRTAHPGAVHAAEAKEYADENQK